MLTPAHLDKYCRIRNGQQVLGIWSPEAYVEFCEAVEHRLSVLCARDRTMLLMAASGYTQKDISRQLKMGLRTVNREMQRINRKMFGEYSAALGTKGGVRCASRVGRPTHAARAAMMAASA